MIEVRITFTKKLYEDGREIFIYKDISVKGHSSDGTINSIKCCAGVTAITCGLINLLNNEKCSLEINKGYFHYEMIDFNEEVNTTINALVHQLHSISTIYPQFFKEFNFIEEKISNEEN